MSSKANQFIKYLRSFGKHKIASELCKMGIHLRQRTPRQQALQVIDRLDQEIVERHINRVNQREAVIQPPKRRAEIIRTDIFSLQLSSFYQSLIKIHHNYLNQYTLKYAKNPLALNQQASRRPNCRDEVDSLLGVQPQIRIDPKHIFHQYQNGAGTLRSTLFPSWTEDDYAKALKKTSSSLWKQKVGNMDGDAMREWLLMMYGVKKQADFEQQSADSMEQMLYPVKMVPNYDQKIRHKNVKAFVHNFKDRQSYYSTVMATLKVDDLANFVLTIKQQLATIKIAPMSLHSFTLALSDTLIQTSPIFHSPTTPQIYSVLQWVCDSLKAFRSYVTFSDIDRSSQQQFFECLASYNSIKLHMGQLSSEATENLLQELDQIEWYDILLLKTEMLIEHVGVSELEGRNVVYKLRSMKIAVEFLANEELDTNMELLQKLLFTIRSGMEWMTLQKNVMQQNGVFGSELQHFFNMKLCSMIIKVIFMGGDTAFDLHLVLSYFWNQFLKVSTLRQQTIQTIFFLINITTRYKCTNILINQQPDAHRLLSHCLQTIANNDYRELLQVEVVNFLQEEAALLLDGHHRQKFLEEIENCLSGGK